MLASTSRSCSSVWSAGMAAFSTSWAVCPGSNASCCGRYPTRSCRRGHLAVVRLLGARQDLQQRAFAGPVRADQAGALGVVEADRDVAEQQARAVGLGEGIDAQQQTHGGILGSDGGSAAGRRKKGERPTFNVRRSTSNVAGETLAERRADCHASLNVGRRTSSVGRSPFPVFHHPPRGTRKLRWCDAWMRWICRHCSGARELPEQRAGVERPAVVAHLEQQSLARLCRGRLVGPISRGHERGRPLHAGGDAAGLERVPQEQKRGDAKIPRKPKPEATERAGHEAAEVVADLPQAPGADPLVTG